MGPTMTPPFRQFVPAWLQKQSWFRGEGEPQLRPIGFLRLEDPAGQVGLETQLLAADDVVYQLPMTFRNAPIDGPELIAVSEHSELGRRWIYDAAADPIWQAVVRDVADRQLQLAPTRESEFAISAQGFCFHPCRMAEIEIRRTPTTGPVPADVCGAVMGRWSGAVEGCLLTLRD